MINIIILFFLILYLIYYNYITNKDTSNIVIVISRFNENLNFINYFPFNKFKIIIYNKGINNDFTINDNVIDIIKLKNVGRESHTYLYHIIQNYYKLSDNIIFLPGSAYNAINYELIFKLLPMIITCTKRSMSKLICIQTLLFNKKVFYHPMPCNIYQLLYNFKIDKYNTTGQDNLKINNESNLELSKIRPYGKWFDYHFPNKSKTINYLTYHGIFSVTKTDILNNPISLYKELILELSNSSNPEVGHYMEKSWSVLFS
jgi:hypothetical protein